MTPNEKGTALEAVVSAIEELILKTSPLAEKKPARIENRKIVRINGVRQEIDVFVTVEIAFGYTAIFIFECKNWKEKVDKNEIVIFSEKIEVCKAQHGYFVAKSFTKDAEARAKLDPRITLKIATEHDPASTILPFGFHFMLNNPTNIKANLKRFGATGSNTYPFDVQGKTVRLMGAEIDFSKYFDTWVTEAINNDTNTLPSGTLPDGDYDRSCNVRREFAAGEFSMDGMDLGSIDLAIEYRTHLKRPAVLSHFEVDGRGRVISLEGFTYNGVVMSPTIFVLGAAGTS